MTDVRIPSRRHGRRAISGRLAVVRRAGFALISVGFLACGGVEARPSTLTSPSGPAVTNGAPVSIPFDYVGQSWIRVAANVGSTRTKLLFDTGGGITILSRDLCTTMKCVPDGTASGKRMSGQTITVPMARVPSIEIAGHRIENARVAVLDTSGLLHPDLGVTGVAGLDLFRDEPVTIDYAAQRFVAETSASLAARKAAGDAVTVRIENDGPSTVVYLPLTIDPSAPPAEMEVDTGSRDLILDDCFMPALGIDRDDPKVKKVEGKDETENAYVRFFAPLPHEVHVAALSRVVVPAGTTTMFQKIIHDGLVGHAFLSGHVVTFDVPHATMIFAR